MAEQRDFIFGGLQAELEQIQRQKAQNSQRKKPSAKIIDWTGVGLLYFGTNVMSAGMCFFVNDTVPNIFGMMNILITGLGMMNILITGLVGTCVAGLYLQALLEKVR